MISGLRKMPPPVPVSPARKPSAAPAGRVISRLGVVTSRQASCFGDQNISGVSGSVKLSLSIPIYAGGALGASIRKANIEQIKSEVDAMATYDEVREAVITSWATLQNASAQITSAQASVGTVKRMEGQPMLVPTPRQVDDFIRTIPQGRSMSWKSGQAPHFTSWMRGLEAPERTGGEVPKNVVVSGESRRQLAWRGG